ncbi:uncharacterized protein [Coffea arabica]|uniref:Uncharacterized protein isoform X1 n=1 Tax=Coffea arabica TaxID=13443 RepID=A0A6P6VNP3_COFAR|nr:E3 ubiquitin-protein ligase SHPRH-like isoform X1 [Coffea arabica]
MGRRKQFRPRRAVGLQQGQTSQAAELDDVTETTGIKPEEQDELIDIGVDKPYFVQVDTRASWDTASQHFDISEIVLSNLELNREFYGSALNEEEFYGDSSRFLLRFSLRNVDGYLNRMKLGHWPELSASSIYLQFVVRRATEGMESNAVMVSGNFDGPDEAVSGLVHLVSLNFLTLRPILKFTLSEDLQSVRMRVEILRRAFDACDSLLDTTRQLWKKSMMNVMAWLRPEVLTSEARYGFSPAPSGKSIDSNADAGDNSASSRKNPTRFDVAGFYEAIKPSKEEPMLDVQLPNLLPELRPYQCRAAHWMIQREKGVSDCSGSGKDQFVNPLCMPLNLIEASATLYYNPFCGNISLRPEYLSSYVSGGILADEMGLGKTVELLSCVFAHRMLSSEVLGLPHSVMQDDGQKRINLRRLKRERVECICGALTESIKYKGLWVQCDVCDAWQHANCVGFSAKRKMPVSTNTSEEQEFSKHSTGNYQKFSRRKHNTKIVVMEGVHICSLCSELIQATESPVSTGATLIVCPTPILSQWHAEIIRHTTPGSLKICLYDGVKDTSCSDTPAVDINELVNADIVLTTYDVLKEDLSHDSDRHEGDRRSMRFEKRYPVVPTLLTRILWWRVCLDEAQMVESNAAAATEMALRLHAKHRWCITGTPIQRKLDDLYGLLKFLRACPFDVFRWWAEVIRDPYEAGDAGAMMFAHSFLTKIMWRSSKVRVAEELHIPPQEESVSWLTLSPIEEHFYQRQHETCLKDAHEVIRNLKNDVVKRKTPGSKTSDSLSDEFITHVEAAKMFNSLLKLRQACCHPQVGSSGLRSLQQSPMTMEEILLALVGKTKIEGEEALRKLVSAINGLAGIAVLKQDFAQAVSLYKEALALAEENLEDFRLDPLLNIHIHHNLAEILLLSSDNNKQSQNVHGSFKEDVSMVCDLEESDQRAVKRAKIDAGNSNMVIDSEKLPEQPCYAEANGSSQKAFIVDPHASSQSTSDQFFRTVCENLKQKYLSLFYSKLSIAQQEFWKSYEQVSIEFSNRKSQHMTWWLDALHHLEQNKDTSSELIRKIGEALSVTLSTSRTSRIASCFGSITSLKYYIQTGLDSLEECRKNVLDRLLEIDYTMENPSEADIDRVRHCPNCQDNDHGPLCVHCELDDLFQVYEARLFRTNKGRNGEVITSAEEVVDLQKKRSALNHFYRTLSQPDPKSALTTNKYEDDGKKRDVKEKVMVSKSPSDLEVVLGIIKNNAKGLLEREGTSAAAKHLFLLEGMRKEYAYARSLARAQAHVLRAHDEIKMASSRLRLKEDEKDNSVDALGPEELDAASTQNSSDKFLAVSSLARIRGQLRYLKGLVQSKQNLQSECPNESTLTESAKASVASATEDERCQAKADVEFCPVCQEKLRGQKMVFQCGHVICCKCLFAITEQRFVHHGNKWVMCPTCRQHTDYGNIAFADDRHNASDASSMLACANSETLTVQGSYSTKIEAVTRRILSIKSKDPIAKILVFTSWNDVLDVLEHAFTANSISYIRMKGGRKSHVAISHFRGQNNDIKGSGKRKKNGKPVDDFVQVLLLLVQHGANGLNLLEAQHVILVEPLLNPAAEAQAIGRVHRIGQENKTLVHRFIVKDTVEESIYKLNKSRNTGSFVSGNRRNQDQPVLTLRDVESLFRVVPSSDMDEEKANGSLMHLPPSVAAAVAAERRLLEGRA